MITLSDAYEVLDKLNVKADKCKQGKHIPAGRYAILFDNGEVKYYPSNPCFGNLRSVIYTLKDGPDGYYDDKDNYLDANNTKASFLVEHCLAAWRASWERDDFYKDAAEFVRATARSKDAFQPSLDYAMAAPKRWDDYGREFVRWVVTDSVYADAFINKDPDEILNRGAVLNVDFPIEYLISACMAYRLVEDTQEIVQLWHKLVEIGVDRNLALFMVHHYRLCDQDGQGNIIFSRYPDKTHYAYSFIGGGHTPYEAGHWMSALRNFLRNNRDNFKRFTSMRDKPYGYSSLSGIWVDKTSVDYETFWEFQIKYDSPERVHTNSWGDRDVDPYPLDEMPSHLGIIAKAVMEGVEENKSATKHEPVSSGVEGTKKRAASLWGESRQARALRARSFRNNGRDNPAPEPVRDEGRSDVEKVRSRVVRTGLSPAVFTHNFGPGTIVTRTSSRRGSNSGGTSSNG